MHLKIFFMFSPPPPLSVLFGLNMTSAYFFRGQRFPWSFGPPQVETFFGNIGKTLNVMPPLPNKISSRPPPPRKKYALNMTWSHKIFFLFAKFTSLCQVSFEVFYFKLLKSIFSKFLKIFCYIQSPIPPKSIFFFIEKCTQNIFWCFLSHIT